MKEILDSNFASVCYDRESNCIIAVWKQNVETCEVEKVIRKVEFAFMRYNARFLINDCSNASIVSLDLFFNFVHNMIKKGVQKIALIGNEEPSEQMKKELTLFSSCKMQRFSCMNTAQEWTNNGGCK